MEAGGVSIAFGYAADRMARLLLDLLTFYRACEQAGTKVVYHDGGEQDFRTPEGALRLQIMGSIAEFQRAQTVDKTKAMHGIRRERGERVGRAPYGSRPGDRVDLVIAGFRETGSVRGTASLLNGLKVPSALGRTWSALGRSFPFSGRVVMTGIWMTDIWATAVVAVETPRGVRG